MSNETWTADQIAALKDGFLAGKSYTNIAFDLGRGFSKSSVAGKVKRLGLAHTAEELRASRQAGGRIAASNSRGKPRPPRPPRLAPPGEPLLDPVLVDEDDGLAIIRAFDARGSGCRWPIGDPCKSTFRFCGAERCADRSYCDQHHAQSYQPRGHR